MLKRKCSSMSEELSSDVRAHLLHKRYASVGAVSGTGLYFNLGSPSESDLGDSSLHDGVSPSSQVFTCQKNHVTVLLMAATRTSTDEKSRPYASALRLLQMVPN
ncbi:hypothetical protein ACFXTH_014879 [Malus domestica]